MTETPETSKTTVEVNVGYVDENAAGGFYCTNAKDINVILVGRCQTGKSSILEAFKNPMYQKGKGAFAETRDPKCHRLILVDANKKEPYQLNVIDTPGLKELRKDSNEDRKDAEILKLAQLCVENSVTSMNAICFVSEAGKMSHEDVDSFTTLMKFFGPDWSDHCMMILTHADRFKNEKLDEFKTEIETRKEIKSVIQYCKLGVFFHGILDKDDLEQYDEDLQNEVKTSKLKRLAPMRTKLIQKLVERSNHPLHMKQLTDLAAHSNSARQKAFEDAYKKMQTNCLIM